MSALDATATSRQDRALRLTAVAVVLGLITIAVTAVGALAAELVRLAPPPLGSAPDAATDDVRRISKESFDLGRRIEQRRTGDGISR
jgi:hypothetical protein